MLFSIHKIKQLTLLLLASFSSTVASQELFYASGDIGRTALHTAAINGNTKIIRMLLENKANVNDTDHYRMDALCFAAHCGHSQAITLLLAHGAQPNSRTITDHDSMTIALSSGQPEALQLLLQHELTHLEPYNELKK